MLRKIRYEEEISNFRLGTITCLAVAAVYITSNITSSGTVIILRYCEMKESEPPADTVLPL